jgi:hypothetical protein
MLKNDIFPSASDHWDGTVLSAVPVERFIRFGYITTHT